MKKYRCPSCKNIFEGEQENCPHCGKKLSFKKKENPGEDKPSENVSSENPSSENNNVNNFENPIQENQNIENIEPQNIRQEEEKTIDEKIESSDDWGLSINPDENNEEESSNPKTNEENKEDDSQNQSENDVPLDNQNSKKKKKKFNLSLLFLFICLAIFLLGVGVIIYELYLINFDVTSLFDGTLISSKPIAATFLSAIIALIALSFVIPLYIGAITFKVDECDEDALDDEEVKKKRKTPFEIIFHIFWIIFVAIPVSIFNGIFACLFIITILFLPAGLAVFRFNKLLYSSPGVDFVLRYGKHKFINTVSFTFGGLIMQIINAFFSILLMVTIIGIPFGIQLLRRSKYLFAPYGAELVYKDSYTRKRKTAYDMNIFMLHVLSNPEKEVYLYNNEPIKVKNMIKEVASEEDRKKFKLPTKRFSFNAGKSIVEYIGEMLGACVVEALLYLVILFNSEINIVQQIFKIFPNESLLLYILIGLVVFELIPLIINIVRVAKTNKALKIYRKKYIGYTYMLPSENEYKEYKRNYIFSPHFKENFTYLFVNSLDGETVIDEDEDDEVEEEEEEYE